MAKKTPPPKPPTVDARQGIILLQRLVQRAESLAQQSIGQTEVQAWDALARDNLERAFGTDSPNISSVIDASGDGGLYVGMPESKWIAHWQSTMRNKIKMVNSCIEQLNTDIEFASPSVPETEHSGARQNDKAQEGAKQWDAFICHASEDKQDFVNSLAQELRSRGLNIWYDDFVLKLGDGLRRSIDNGLLRSKFGIVVLSPSFFSKQWPQRELDGLASLELDGTKVILPVWHKIDESGVRARSPTLADRKAISSGHGVNIVADAIEDGMGRAKPLITAAGPKQEGQKVQSPSSVPGHTHAEPTHAATAAPQDSIVDGHVESAESRTLFRFEQLRRERLRGKTANPYAKGYWQATIALQGHLKHVSLTDMLDILRSAKLNLSGWDIGLVSTESEFSPYPFHDAIECWMVGEGNRGPGRSDFWRAEPFGTFSIVRGYREDEQEYGGTYPDIQFDASIALWRITEVLLYLESFARHLGRDKVNANVSFRWNGLTNRRLGDGREHPTKPWPHICRQDAVKVQMNVRDSQDLQPRLMNLVQKLSHDLFQAFTFYRPTDEEVMQLLYGLYDFNQNRPVQF